MPAISRGGSDFIDVLSHRLTFDKSCYDQHSSSQQQNTGQTLVFVYNVLISVLG